MIVFDIHFLKLILLVKFDLDTKMLFKSSLKYCHSEKILIDMILNHHLGVYLLYASFVLLLVSLILFWIVEYKCFDMFSLFSASLTFPRILLISSRRPSLNLSTSFPYRLSSSTLMFSIIEAISLETYRRCLSAPICSKCSSPSW